MNFCKWLIHKVLFLFVLFVFLLSIIFIKRKAKKFTKNPNNYFPADRAKIAYKAFKKVLFLYNIKVKSIDFDKIPNKQMLFVANHKHNLDFIQAFVALYESDYSFFICPFAKMELKKFKSIAAVMTLIEGIFINRQNGRSIINAFQQENALFEQKKSIFIFPETTRVPGLGFEKEFKAGTLKSAYKNMITICALTIYGSDIKRYKKEKFSHTVYVKYTGIFNPSDYINVEPKYLITTIKNNIVNDYNKLNSQFNN